MRSLGVLSICLLFVGCQGTPEGQFPTAPVEITVLYNGKPVEEAVVTFVPKSSANTTPGQPGPSPGFGKTNAQGKVKLSTYSAEDGAVIGEHFVGIVKQEFVGGKPQAEAKSEADYAPPASGSSPLPKVKDLLPRKYSMPTTSTLSANVEKGKPNQITFELKD